MIPPDRSENRDSPRKRVVELGFHHVLRCGGGTSGDPAAFLCTRSTTGYGGAGSFPPCLLTPPAGSL